MNFPFLAPKDGKISVFLAQERKTVLKIPRFVSRSRIITENGFLLVTVRFAFFLAKNGTYLSVLAVQISEEINTENVAAVSHALFHKKRKTVCFSLRKSIFSSVKARKKFQKNAAVRFGTVRFVRYGTYGTVRTVRYVRYGTYGTVRTRYKIRTPYCISYKSYSRITTTST